MRREWLDTRRRAVLRRRDASFIKRKEDDADISTFAEDEGVPFYEARLHYRSGRYCYSYFGKCCLPQGEHGFGEQKYTAYLGIWEDKETYLKDYVGVGILEESQLSVNARKKRKPL